MTRDARKKKIISFKTGDIGLCQFRWDTLYNLENQIVISRSQNKFDFFEKLIYETNGLYYLSLCFSIDTSRVDDTYEWALTVRLLERENERK